MTSKIEIRCIKKEQVASLKTIILNQESLYKIVDHYQKTYKGSLGFNDENANVNVEHEYNISVWIKDKKINHYSILGNGQIIRHWSRYF